MVVWMINNKIILKSINVVTILLVLILLSATVLASPSVTIKRTNPGIAGQKAAEIIYDVVNVDIDYSMEGFILCRSPDDIKITSVMGIASGSGAQYVSPMFEMEPGPSQKAVYITIESDYPGDYSTGCLLKYAPFKIINGTKCYQKMNLEYLCEQSDSVFREIRLDKTVPFVSSSVIGDVSCPAGKSDCRVSDVIINTIENNSNTLLILLIIFMIVLSSIILYFIKTYKKY